MDSQILQDTQAVIRDAFEHDRRLRIQGGNSKAFLGPPAQQAPLILDTHPLQGIIDYQPEELFVRVAAGTPVAELRQMLAEASQMLAFEPAEFDGQATIGGHVACGLSGASAPWLGTTRDFLLGCRLIDGRGQALRFGGEVIKNVAGYDVTRLQCGAFGSLGLLTELSVKTLPLPERQASLTLELDQPRALELFRRLDRQPWPVSAACWHQGLARIRLWGEDSAVGQSCRQIGGQVSDNDDFWHQLREQRLPFFDSEQPLWRLSLPRHTGPLELPGDALIDWGGAQRWLLSAAPASEIQALAKEQGGHASSWRNGPLPPLPPALVRLQERIRAVFDPKRLFNPGKLEA